MMNTSDSDFQHLLGKSRDAKRRGERAWGPQSTGEKLAVALALNRADWLAKMDYTLAEAIDRVDEPWLAMIPKVARMLRDET